LIYCFIIHAADYFTPDSRHIFHISPFASFRLFFITITLRHCHYFFIDTPLHIYAAFIMLIIDYFHCHAYYAIDYFHFTLSLFH